MLDIPLKAGLDAGFSSLELRVRSLKFEVPELESRAQSEKRKTQNAVLYAPCSMRFTFHTSNSRLPGKKGAFAVLSIGQDALLMPVPEFLNRAF